MLHAKTGLVVIIRETECTVVRFKAKQIIDVFKYQTVRELKAYLRHFTKNPLYVLLDPSYSSLKRVLIPKLKPWDRYLYLRRLQHNVQETEVLQAVVFPEKRENSVGLLTCKRTKALSDWINTIAQFGGPILGGSFKAIEAKHLLKRLSGNWDQNWHVLMGHHAKGQFQQIAFFQGQLWLTRTINGNGSSPDLQSSLEYIGKQVPERKHSVTIYIGQGQEQTLQFDSLSIQTPQTCLLDWASLLTTNLTISSDCLFDAAIAQSLWHDQHLDTCIQLFNESDQHPYYTLPKLLTTLSSSVTILFFFIALGIKQYASLSSRVQIAMDSGMGFSSIPTDTAPGPKILKSLREISFHFRDWRVLEVQWNIQGNEIILTQARGEKNRAERAKKMHLLFPNLTLERATIRITGFDA